jgi:hypothetical protein
VGRGNAAGRGSLRRRAAAPPTVDNGEEGGERWRSLSGKDLAGSMDWPRRRLDSVAAPEYGKP